MNIGYLTENSKKKKSVKILFNTPLRFSIPKNFRTNVKKISASSVENNINSLIEEIKEKLKKFDKKNENEIVLIEYTEENIKTIYFILNKYIRNESEIFILKNYLMGFEKLINVIKNNENFNEIINNLSIYLKCEKMNKNTLLMKYGDKGNKCYILLEGKVSILLPKENKIKISFLNYFKHLIKLKILEEEELLKNILFENKESKYKIEPNIFEELFEKLNYFLNKKNKKYINFQILNFDEFEIKEILSYMNEIKNSILPNYKNKTPEKYIESTYLNNIENNICPDDEEVIIYSYIEITQLEKGQIFGELALQNIDKKRTASIICLTNCIFGTLSRKAYFKCYSDIEIRKRKNNIIFFINLNLFKGMTYNVFETKFFNFFIQKHVKKGEKLIIQNEPFKYIYFIKEGEFELNSNINFNEIYQIILEKRNIKLNLKKIPNPNLKEFLKICIIKNNDIIGLNDIIYNKNIVFVNAICVSKTGTLFQIEKKYLDNIIYKSSIVENNIEITVKNKEKIITDRLLNYFNIKHNNSIDLFRNEINDDELIKKIFLIKEKKFITKFKNPNLLKKRVKSSKYLFNKEKICLTNNNNNNIDKKNNNYINNLTLINNYNYKSTNNIFLNKKNIDLNNNFKNNLEKENKKEENNISINNYFKKSYINNYLLTENLKTNNNNNSLLSKTNSQKNIKNESKNIYKILINKTKIKNYNKYFLLNKDNNNNSYLNNQTTGNNSIKSNLENLNEAENIIKKFIGIKLRNHTPETNYSFNFRNLIIDENNLKNNNNKYSNKIKKAKPFIDLLNYENNINNKEEILIKEFNRYNSYNYIPIYDNISYRIKKKGLNKPKFRTNFSLKKLKN